MGGNQPRARNTADLLQRYKARGVIPVASKSKPTKGGYQSLGGDTETDELAGASKFDSVLFNRSNTATAPSTATRMTNFFKRT